MTEYLLEARGLVKSYGHVQVLRQTDFHVEPGKVTALIGDNGAGKSTLVKILSGVMPPQGGQILLNGKPISFDSPTHARSCGIETVYQDLALAPDLGPAENAYIGRELVKPGLLGKLGVLDKKRMRREAFETFTSMGTDVKDMDAAVAALSGGQKQSVAICRSVMWAKGLIFMDEPTAALGVRQTRRVLDLIRRVRDRGIAVVLISHNMPEVLEVSDSIQVLRLGQRAAEFNAKDATVDQLVGAMTGALELSASTKAKLDGASVTQFEKNDGVGTSAAEAPSEWKITTPTEGPDDGVASEGADGGDIGLPQDAVALGGMSPRARLVRRGLSSSPAYMFGALVVIFAVFSFLDPDIFPHWDNIQLVISNSAVLMTMAVGMTFVMVAAGFDLSIGSVLVFSGVMASKAMTSFGGNGYGTFLVGLVVALVSGAVWGAFNGFCVTRLKVPALITTLGTLGAALGIANLITDGNDVSTVPTSLGTIQSASWFGFPPIFYIAVFVVLVGGATLRFTKFGRHTYVVGSNDEAARRAGINVNNHLLKLYMLSGTLAGLAGMMSLIRFSTTTIGGHGDDALNVITGVILGGTSLYGGAGTILGTVIGLFIPAVLQDGFNIRGLQSFWQQVATGFILIVAVYIDQLKRKSRDRA